MLGTFVDVGAIILGSFFGVLLKKGLPQRFSDIIMKGLGLCVLLMGIKGILNGKNILILIISIVVGSIIGELLNLNDNLGKAGRFIERKLQKESGDKPKKSLAEGFVSATLLFCVGAVAIVGSLESGLTGAHQTLFSKALIDAVASLVMASSMGIGVAFSAVPVLIYQGSITLLAQWVSPLLGDTVIAEMTCVGSLLIIGIAFNMMNITKLKVMNYVPAIFMPIILCLFM